MSINVLEAVENHYASVVPRVLEKLIPLYGVDAEIRKSKKAVDDKYVKVYQVNASSYGDPLPLLKVLVVGDDWTPFDLYSISTLVEGLLYDPSNVVESGDLITIKRKDGLVRRFKVISKEGVGSTTTVVKRWLISAVGD